MFCRIVATRLADYSAGRLGPGQHAWMSRHLDVCGPCGRRWEAFLNVMEMVSSVEALEPPPDMWENVRQGIENRSRERQALLTGSSAASSMRCDQLVAQLGSYSAGVLRERRMVRIEHHLSACRECSQEWRSFQATLRLVESLPDRQPPPYLWEKVRYRLDARPRRAPWWQRPKLAPAFAGGLALAAVVAVVLVMQQPPPVAQPMATAQVASNLDFLQQHAAMAQNELFADKAALGTLVNYAPADEGR